MECLTRFGFWRRLNDRTNWLVGDSLVARDLCSLGVLYQIWAVVCLLDKSVWTLLSIFIYLFFNRNYIRQISLAILLGITIHFWS